MANNESRSSGKLDDLDLSKGPARPDSSESPQDETKGGSGKGGPGSNSEGSKRKDYTTKVTVQIDDRVVEKLRSAVHHTPGLTMWQVVQKGVREVIKGLEERRGEPFPSFDGGLDGGRPPKGSSRPQL